MNTAFSQMGFKIEPTSDGSPTLRLSSDGESMHHSGGAAKETNYIYGGPLRSALALQPSASVCVVGLGLGYIEMAWALCEPASESCLTSVEIVPVLRNEFIKWLKTSDAGVYDEIATCLRPGSDILKIKNRLLSNFQGNPIQTDVHTLTGGPWNIICYDAFSKKSNADLWDEHFLNDFLNLAAAEDCVFTTYACTGSLKKTLKKHGFRLIERENFPGKKNSTLALRGKFTSESAFRTF